MRINPSRLSAWVIAISLSWLSMSSLWPDVVEIDQIRPTPIKTIQVPFPWFAASEVSGYAEVLFEVTETGETRDFVILKSSHRAFSLALIDTLEDTKFHPGSLNGRPVSSRLIFKNHFISDRIAAERKIGDKTRSYRVDERSLESFIIGQPELDHPIERLKSLPPVPPDTFRDKNLAGEVLVEFYIDNKGTVRAPLVLFSSDELLSEAVLNAIRLWIFSPPMKNGEAVTTLARQRFYF